MNINSPPDVPPPTDVGLTPEPPKTQTPALRLAVKVIEQLPRLVKPDRANHPAITSYLAYVEMRALREQQPEAAVPAFITNMPEPPHKTWSLVVDRLRVELSTSYDFGKIPGMVGGHAKEAAIRIALQGISGIATNYMMRLLSPNDKKETDVATMTTQSVLNTLIGAVSHLRAALEQGLRTEKEVEVATYHALMLESKEYVAKLPLYLRKAIAALDESLDLPTRHYGVVSTPDTMLKDRLLLMSVPQQTKDAGHYLEPEKRAEIERRVEQLLATLPQASREVFSNLILHIRDNSSPKAQGYPAQIYIQGPAGTGKTTVAKAIGKALGLPSVTIRVNELGPGMGLEDAVADAVIKSGIANPIIILDDVGNWLNALGGVEQLNRFFDPNSTTRWCNQLGIEMDMRKITFICTGNPAIIDAALISRLPQAQLPKLDRPQKESVANKAFEAKRAELAAILPESEVVNITFAAKRYLDYVLAKDEKENQGGRILDAVIRNQLFGLIRTLGVDAPKAVMHAKIDEAFARSKTTADEIEPPQAANGWSRYGGDYVPA